MAGPVDGGRDGAFMRIALGHAAAAGAGGEVPVGAVLVRGEDKYGHFDDERRPIHDAGPEERAFHAEAVARFRAMNAVESSENKIAVVKR